VAGAQSRVVLFIKMNQDRIAERAVEMPVQAPNKYELAINLKTAKTLGLSLSQSLLARADEVIE
jgi:ABC-type uncharacterized transport system substrate-binding protein